MAATGGTVEAEEDSSTIFKKPRVSSSKEESKEQSMRKVLADSPEVVVNLFQGEN